MVILCARVLLSRVLFGCKTMMKPLEQHERLPRMGIFLLVALTFAWGLNWPIMKMVMSEVPPLYFRSCCLLLGGCGVLAIARLHGSVRVPPGVWPRLLLIALFNIVIWNVLIIYGLLLLPSGRAALLGYTMPIWSILLSVLLLGEPLTRQRLLALLFGFVGILVLLSGSFGGLLNAPLGVFLMLTAACSWALGVVLLKRLPTGMSTTAMTGQTMVIGALPMLLAAVILETDRLIMPSFWPWFGIIYNIFVTFMFGQWAWNRIVLMVPVAVSSLSALLIPLVGVCGGAVFLGETPGWREAVAALCIFAAIAVVSVKKLNV